MKWLKYHAHRINVDLIERIVIPVFSNPPHESTQTVIIFTASGEEYQLTDADKINELVELTGVDLDNKTPLP